MIAETVVKWTLGGALVVSLGLNAWLVDRLVAEPLAMKGEASPCERSASDAVLTKMGLSEKQRDLLQNCCFS